MRWPLLFGCLLGLIFDLAGAGAAESHRVIVVSAMDERRSTDTCEIRLVEIETGKVLAQARVGDTADAGLSQKGDVLAISSGYSVDGKPERRLELYRTSDLALIKRGTVPFSTNVYKRVPSTARIQFSPDGKEIVVQKMKGHDAVLTRVRLELDDAGAFQTAGEPLTVVGARGVSFLRTDDWPRVTVWGSVDGLIHVLDLEKSMHVSELAPDPLADVPVDFPRRHLTGAVVTSDGRHGCYVPHQHGRPDESRHGGHLHQLDLTAEQPRLMRRSEQPQPILRAGLAAVSEAAGVLVVAEQKYSETGPFLAPSSRLKFFHTATLIAAREIDLSLNDCESLTTSHDGKYLYAVDFKGGISVVGIATCKEVKTLKDVGAHPALVLALP